MTSDELNRFAQSYQHISKQIQELNDKIGASIQIAQATMEKMTTIVNEMTHLSQEIENIKSNQR